MCVEIVVNCENLGTCIELLSKAYAISKDKLIDELKKIDIEELYKTGTSQEELHTYISKKFGIAKVDLSRAFWFHFSSTLDVSSIYNQGLLPTDKILSKLMYDCYSLIERKWATKKWSKKKRLRKKWSKKEWSRRRWSKIWITAIKELPDNDRCKFSEQVKDFGPYGMLIKEVGIDCSSWTHPYFKRPEIVEGILSTIDRKFGTNLMHSFELLSQSIVVTFIADINYDAAYIFNSILMYVYNKIHNLDISGCDVNFNAKNKPIFAKDIVNIEKITFDNETPILTSVDSNYKIVKEPFLA